MTTKKLYELTDEHRAQLKPWTDRWIANAMSTKPMDDEDRKQTRIAIEGTYEAAGKEKPIVVFAPSPFVAAFATGFASAIWHKRGLDATSDATYDATHAATSAATRAATHAAAYGEKETDLSKWYVMPGDMAKLASGIGVGAFGLQCASRAYALYQGGNQWSGWTAYLSFFRHVAKLPLDYSNWKHFESATIHCGPRYVHEKFCIISDRPRVLKVDPQNRPHCEDGPFCAWSDGCELYSWHGTRVPADWIVNRKTLDPKIALTHENVELRRAAAEIVGWAKVLECVSARVVDEDKDPEIGVLLEADIPDSPGARFLKVRCGTGRTFVLPVPGEMKTALDANSWTYGIDAKELLELEART